MKACGGGGNGGGGDNGGGDDVCSGVLVIAVAVGVLPQSSGSGHSRGRSLLSFSNDG